MQLSLAWFGFRYLTPANYLQAAALLGVGRVEISLAQQIIHDPHYAYSLDGIRHLEEAADEAGVRIVAGVSALDLAGDWDVWGRRIDSSTTTFTRAAARRVIDIAAALHLEVVRITESNIPVERQGQATAYMRAYGKVLRELGDYAAERGLRIAAENYGVSAVQMRELLDAADHPAVGTLYDPCNYFRLGEDPITALELLHGHIFYCHVKDAIRGESRDPDSLFSGSRWPPPVAVGEGEINWKELLAELARSYDGHLAIEYEVHDDVVRGTRNSIKNLRAAAADAGVDLAK